MDWTGVDPLRPTYKTGHSDPTTAVGIDRLPSAFGIHHFLPLAPFKICRHDKSERRDGQGPPPAFHRSFLPTCIFPYTTTPTISYFPTFFLGVLNFTTVPECILAPAPACLPHSF